MTPEHGEQAREQALDQPVDPPVDPEPDGSGRSEPARGSAPRGERPSADPARGSLDDSARREAMQRSGAGAPSTSPLAHEPARGTAARHDERTQALAAPAPSAATAQTTGAGSAPGTPPLAGTGATSVLPTPGARTTTPERPRTQSRTAPARPAARPAPRSAGRGRRARLVVQRVDAWSVFLFSLVASVCLGIVLLVAVATLYLVLSNLGVLSSVNTLLGEVLGSGDADDVVEPFFTPGRVLGATAVLAAVDVVLLTVLATLSALLYNLCASLTGGIEVVLGERD
ncbi:MAG: DUF3566 domain-containing protein [Actinomycetes bacterium]